MFIFTGQSFMLHQIRKMVGLTIAISRGLTAEEVINKAYDYPKLDIPIAPSSGLLLEEVIYLFFILKSGLSLS